MNEEEPKVSKYNSGIAIILRLDNLWKDTHSHSRAGLFSKWNSDLDRIWCELSRDLIEKEFKKTKVTFDEFDGDMEKLGNFEDSAPSGFKKLEKGKIIQRNKQYKKLMDKELFLRRLENQIGKGTAWDSGDEDDFD